MLPAPVVKFNVDAEPTLVPALSTVTPLPPPPPPPASRLQEFVAMQPYKFCPAVAVVTKNICPVVHVPGNDAPIVIGFVGLTALKSADFD